MTRDRHLQLNDPTSYTTSTTKMISQSMPKESNDVQRQQRSMTDVGRT
jgi:hypothetical protein